MIGTANGLQNSGKYERIDDGEEITSVEPFPLWAKRMISKPLYQFLAAIIIIAGLILCIYHPWSRNQKTKHSIILQIPYEGAELFEYAEYKFGINASVILGNSTLHMTIWEILVPLVEQPFIDCPEEPYNMTSDGSTSIITLTNMSSTSDCIYKKLHDSMSSKLKIALSNEMQYDAYHEQITVHFTILDLIIFDVRMRPTTSSPTISPTYSPTLNPTTETPSKRPTKSPTHMPTTLGPSRHPTRRPTRSPASDPTTAPPTRSPTLGPSRHPTRRPTRSPTSDPTTAPPTRSPTAQPTTPTNSPTKAPSDKDVPMGLYAGNKVIISYEVDAQMVFNEPGLCNIQILISAANLNITCISEAYTMSGSSIELTDVNNEGDCVHDELGDDVTLKSITFDEEFNEVSIAVKYKFLSETIALAHKNEENSFSFAI